MKTTISHASRKRHLDYGIDSHDHCQGHEKPTASKNADRGYLKEQIREDFASDPSSSCDSYQLVPTS